MGIYGRDIGSYTLPELEAEMERGGLPGYRARQIFGWLEKSAGFDKMANLPVDLKQTLQRDFDIYGAEIIKKQISAQDGTIKYLFLLHDGQTIESVLMKYNHGWSQCISTQAGCKMGCTFCATGAGGFARNLQPSEMLAQIRAAQQDFDGRVSSVVLMGMGEPLDNFDNVVRFLELVSTGGMPIGMRHITLSTCGLVDRIYRLMELKLQITLSVSLHAPDDEMRRQVMPAAKLWSIEQLLEACSDYAECTGRRVSFEYALTHGFNDSDVCAARLAALLGNINCHVNLIPLNDVNGGGRGSTPERVERFRRLLERAGINATVRRTLGADIDAACGQLKAKSFQEA